MLSLFHTSPVWHGMATHEGFNDPLSLGLAARMSGKLRATAARRNGEEGYQEKEESD